MPAHPKTTDTQIIQAARRLVEREGRDGFSMNDVAAAVGIRAPSLYGRFKDRASLLAAVELYVCAELEDLLGKSILANNPEATLMAQAQAVRGFEESEQLFAAVRHPFSAHRRRDCGAGAAVVQLIAPLAALVGEGRYEHQRRSIVRAR